MSDNDNLASYRQSVADMNAARLEDLGWMRDTGESFLGAARRLNLTPNTLEKWCERRDLHGLVRELKARNPRMGDDMDRRSDTARRNALVRWSA